MPDCAQLSSDDPAPSFGGEHMAVSAVRHSLQSHFAIPGCDDGCLHHSPPGRHVITLQGEERGPRRATGSIAPIPL